ncbi:hypothetical protein HELRODRAFT_168868 [Helobdella robusta]|uniref:Receptor ligand binding region domain-containing protein n=1 Tax=Helobdella robusta TaxID=6412 RepID=T1F126_HELRO|nr:hypothetical protein HELRODRAFT_168868 [Helobdella robusta]ESO08946.1 hypothetical protein HELRODRAFT_168868 [Helobdella robusta]
MTLVRILRVNVVVDDDDVDDDVDDKDDDKDDDDDDNSVGADFGNNLGDYIADDFLTSKSTQFNSLIVVPENLKCFLKRCELLESGVFTLLTSVDMGSQSLIESLSRTFHVTHIVVSESPSPSSSSSSSSSSSFSHALPSFVLYLRPLFERAYYDLFKHFGWKRLIYLYDNEYGLYHLEHLYSVINKGDFKIDPEIIHIADVTNCYDTLRQIDHKRFQHSSGGGGGSHNSYHTRIFLDFSNPDAFNSFLKQETLLPRA